MLIGQERQSGTWGWASSLPVSSQAVSSLAISISTATLVGALLGIVPAILVLNGYITFERTEIALTYISTTTIVVFLEVVAFFSQSVDARDSNRLGGGRFIADIRAAMPHWAFRRSFRKHGVFRTTFRHHRLYASSAGTHAMRFFCHDRDLSLALGNWSAVASAIAVVNDRCR